MAVLTCSSLKLLLLAIIAILLAKKSHGAFITSPVDDRQQRIPIILRNVDGKCPSTTHLFLSTESSSETPSVEAPISNTGSSTSSTTASDSSPLEGIQNDLKMRWRIFQESGKEGYGFKQKIANVMAGEYDQEATKSNVQELIGSAPCVMFTWERSPSCVKALEAFETMGISDQIKIVRLDDPWSEGNPMRAELGKMVGRSSVPFIFIDGKYIGGFDGGISEEEAPGLQTMAFQGTLRPTLDAAGIMFSKDS